jgi:tetrahydrodipicolinate N-acetyltransferase
VRKVRRFQRFLPETNDVISVNAIVYIALRVSIIKTLYFRIRFGGWCIVARGTRVRVGRGSKIDIAKGSFLFMGFAHFSPVSCSIHIGRNARLSIAGTVLIHRGTRIFVHDGAHLEIGTRTYINDCSTVTCFERISIGSGCSISWNTNILDTNVHELVIEGESRPRSQRVSVGDHVWIGTGVTVLAGVAIGEGAVIGAGSVVTSDVPDRAVVAGNPSRIVHSNVSWRQ